MSCKLDSAKINPDINILRKNKIARRYSRRKSPAGLKKRYDKNEYIRAPKLRVIDDNGENLGVVSREDALNRAKEKELDLVLISPNEDMPVAKIIDWSKFKYEQTKKAKSSKGKTSTVKEWRFFAKTQEFDIENKMKYAMKFLDKGGKAKFIVRYKRRDQMSDLYAAMDRIFEIAGDRVEKVSDVTREGRNLSVFVKKAPEDKNKEEKVEINNTIDNKNKDGKKT